MNTTKTVSDSVYKHFIWKNPNPMPPCGEDCPLFWLWEEEELSNED